jgi:hypothetical protein
MKMEVGKKTFRKSSEKEIRAIRKNTLSEQFTTKINIAIVFSTHEKI